MTIPIKQIYQLKIQLKGIRPPIWRRFLISSTSSLADLHTAIQIIMGWTDTHLHQFITNNAIYSIIDDDSFMDWNKDLKNEADVKVKDVLKKEGNSILYEYDFGDGWEHQLTLEKILPFSKTQPLPLCIEGKRGCPPEDVGGVWGYTDFLEKWLDKNDPEHTHVKEWAGEYFDSEKFSIQDINATLTDIGTN